MGRPSSYTDAIAQEICDSLAETGSIRETAAVIGVDRKTITRWTMQHENFATAIARAKQDGYDERAEQAVADAMQAKDAGLGRLAFDAQRWLLSKLDPKRYGEATLLKHADADGNTLDLAAQMAAARARTEAKP